MVRTGDEHTDRTEATSDTNKKKREPGRLTPMPDWLMKWWIPFALAVALFLGSMFITSIWGSATFDEIMRAIQDCPKRWPFHMRTPSREEIEVCLTITAAGFAFSAWQQRNHDNITREEDALAKQEAEKTARETAERNRREQIERDEYWKRRKQIYQLLGSKNPGLRLGAVALLAELADSAAHSTLLNKNEKQQLQRHIIDTLCLQIRREGYNTPEEGSEKEHAHIQQSIIEAILHRTNHHSSKSRISDWSHETIEISHSEIIAPITISRIDTEASLILNETTFHRPFIIKASKLGPIKWSRATFKENVTIGDWQNRTILQIDTTPNHINSVNIQNSTIITEHRSFYIDLKSTNSDPDIEFTHLLSNCSFYTNFCLCNEKCPCRGTSLATACTCWVQKECNCESGCINANILVTDFDNNLDNKWTRPSRLSLSSCRINFLTVSLTHNLSTIDIMGNHFRKGLLLIFREDDNKNHNTLHSGSISVTHNRFITYGYSKPIRIEFRTEHTINPRITFKANTLISPDYFRQLSPEVLDNPFSNEAAHALKCTQVDNQPEVFHFEDTFFGTDNHQLLQPWTTGRNQS